jgi:hypothetical protein
LIASREAQTALAKAQTETAGLTGQLTLKGYEGAQAMLAAQMTNLQKVQAALDPSDPSDAAWIKRLDTQMERAQAYAEELRKSALAGAASGRSGAAAVRAGANPAGAATSQQGVPASPAPTGTPTGAAQQPPADNVVAKEPVTVHFGQNGSYTWPAGTPYGRIRAEAKAMGSAHAPAPAPYTP